MPFASEKQRRYMYSQHRDIAERWTQEAKDEAERKSKGRKRKVKPEYIKPWSQPKTEHGRKQLTQRDVALAKSWPFRNDPGDHSRQGAHGVNRGWEEKAMRDYQLAGGAVALTGAAHMPTAGRILEHGQATSVSRSGKAFWRGLESGRTKMVIPASNAVGRQMLKIKPVADVARFVPRRARPLLLMTSGAAMMRGRLPDPVQVANTTEWTG